MKLKHSAMSFEGYFPGTKGSIRDYLGHSFGMFAPAAYKAAEAELRKLQKVEEKLWAKAKIYKVTVTVEEVK